MPRQSFPHYVSPRQHIKQSIQAIQASKAQSNGTTMMSGSSMLPSAQPFRRTTSSTRDGGSVAASSLNAGSSSTDGTSRAAVSFSSPQVAGGSKASFFSSAAAASGTADGTCSSIGTASTAASSGMAPTSTGGSSLPPPGSESKYRRGASSYSSAGSANQAQHVPNGAAAAPMTAHMNDSTTPADNRSGPGGSNRPTEAAGPSARSGLQHYLSSVPTYRSLQQQTASMLRKKNGWSGGNNANAPGASQMAVASSSSFGSTGSSGAVDPQQQQPHIVLPRLANLANSFHAGPHAHASSAGGGSSGGGGVGGPAPSRFYNPWRRRSVSSGGAVRRGVRGGGSGGTMIMSPFAVSRGISGGGTTSRSRRRIVLPILVLLLIGWYAMGSGDGSGKGPTRRGRKKGVSNFHKSSNIRAATTISAARAEFEAGVPMPANGASTTTAKAQTAKKHSPITTVALTHNATNLVGKRMKRQSGDDHDSSDEGVVVAKARR